MHLLRPDGGTRQNQAQIPPDEGTPGPALHFHPRDGERPAPAGRRGANSLPARLPYGAITFGNVLDPAAAVSRAKSLPRHRSLLSSLGTDPGTGYLAPAGNPNPAMEA